MTTLVWDQLEDRTFERGVNQGVLFLDTGDAVAWNGLTSVAESYSEGALTECFFDGQKYADLIGPRTYQATIKALSIPEEFLVCLGEAPIRPGMRLGKQPRQRFNLAYRTLVGSGGDYKLHLIYNASIVRTVRAYATQSNSPTPSTFEWLITAMPPVTAGITPTAHIYLDSSKTDPLVLADLEELLYGTVSTDPIFPSQQAVFDLFNP